MSGAARPARGGVGGIVALVGRGAGGVAGALGALLGEVVTAAPAELVEVERLLPGPGGRLLFVPIAGLPGGVLVCIDEALAGRRPASWPEAPAVAVHSEIANILASKLLGAVGEGLSERLLPEPPIALAGPGARRELEALGGAGRGAAAAALTLRCGGGESLARLGLVFAPT